VPFQIAGSQRLWGVASRQETSRAAENVLTMADATTRDATTA
jgi:hypothetical protein